MVTLGNTQNFSEFELHARAVLGWPILEIVLQRNGASAVILAEQSIERLPEFKGIESAAATPSSDLRLFGKPSARPFRRMGVTLSFGPESVEFHVERAKFMASKIAVV